MPHPTRGYDVAMSSPFVHLHTHSHYSLLDGAVRVPDLLDAAVEHEMPALALTDHGVLYGALEFYKGAAKRGIKPILGFEAYVVDGDATTTAPPGEPRKRHHLTLLATSARGYQNLSRLSSLGWVKGHDGRKPCIDRTMIAANNEDVLALSGCASGQIARALLDDDMARAQKLTGEFRDLFGVDNFFLESIRDGTPSACKVTAALESLSRESKAPIVATNDVHYRHPSGHIAQDALICIGSGQKMHATERRFQFESKELFFRSPAQMAELFGEDDAALRRTTEIADRCNIELDLETMHLPRFEIPTDETPEAYLRRLCIDGLRERYGELTPPVMERLDKEYDVITSMGFTAYFLIVWDLIRHAREQDIPVGPGRGSAAGSIIAYALKITQLDPLRYDLLFERFLNSSRISMPDIDIDFCRDRREEMIDYTREKYGSDNVCQIVTFGTLAAKAAIRDAGRVLDIPLPDVDRIAKRIPEQQQRVSLEKFLADDDEFREMFEETAELRELLDVSLKIEGMARNTSTHAAGVVITDEPLIDLVPLCLVQDQVNTQFQMSDLEEIGLLKMDFLGLKNLTILEKAKDLVKLTRNVDIDYATMVDTDEQTYALLKRGDCGGVFQLESSGMRELVVRLAPDCFEDIIALIALYRPGPLQSGMVDSFVNRKHGVEPIRFGHEVMEDVLSDTYGCMVYQEQIMLLAQRMGQLSLNEADGLRKAMGKKQADRMESYREKFLAGADQTGVGTEVAQQVWDDMSRFAEYGFNKSHSAAYGLITYQTAYMKAHYPGEFIAALMSCDANNTAKLAGYVEELARANREVRNPSINTSLGDFTLDGDSIVFGLNAVRGVGSRVVEAIIDARRDGPFTSLDDLLDRVDMREMNRASFDALVRAGTLDEVEPNRRALLASSERLLRDALRSQADRAAGQGALFGSADALAPASSDGARLDNVDMADDQEIAVMEKDALGVCISVDPMAEWRPVLRLLSTHTIAEIMTNPEDKAEVVLGGTVANIRHTTIKAGKSAGQAMAMFRLQGLGGAIGTVVFPRTYSECRALIRDGQAILIRGTVDASRDEPNILVDEVHDLSDPAIAAGKRLLIDIRPGAPLDDRLTDLRRLLDMHRGPTTTYLSIDAGEGNRHTYKLGPDFRAGLSVEFVREAEELLGVGAVHLR